MKMLQIEEVLSIFSVEFWVTGVRLRHSKSHSITYRIIPAMMFIVRHIEYILIILNIYKNNYIVLYKVVVLYSVFIDFLLK